MTRPIPTTTTIAMLVRMVKVRIVWPLLLILRMAPMPPSTWSSKFCTRVAKGGGRKMGNRLKGRKSLSKRLYLLAFVCFFLCSGFSFLGYLAYHTAYGRYLPLAQDGIQHLRRAEALLARMPQNPLDAPTVNQAQHEFAAALTSFTQVNAGLQSLPGLGVEVGTFIPVYGARLRAAVHLVPLAVEISQAGMASCDILKVFIAGFHNPFKAQEHGLTMADLAIIDQDFQRIKAAFHMVVDEASQVQPADLQFDPHLTELFATLQKDMPLLQQWLDATGKLLTVFPTLLGIGKPANYLIEVLDSTELRPAGGFIGNYGILTLSGGRVTTAHITDVDLLDKPYTAAGHSIPYPSAYTWFPYYLGAGSWSLSNSNLDADFPTAARYGELNYQREGGNVPVQGVIAITPALISHALEITGPIAIPEYHETVTAQNLIDRIHYHQLGPAGEGPDYVASPDGHSSLRKRFTELLAEHFLAHVRQLAPSALPRFMQLLVNSVRSKDLQIYLNSSVAENLLHQFHLDAAIQSSVGDGLFVVDANLSA